MRKLGHKISCIMSLTWATEALNMH
ncbi:hypothetical protein F383_02241 [Gossypium arboreum]|uniref:Uncharacterized protein n=1 Tax=Gossypium arboreum TaxID=29729 RepID=A0A0B0PQW0_GOSAR|nr:hypothetical protein F383_02241 [Gossypium arboreum]